MATDGGPKQRRPRKPPVVVREREREQEDEAPDSESPERLRRSSWCWFKRDELAAENAPDVVDSPSEVTPAKAGSLADALEPLAEVVAHAPPENVVEGADEVVEQPSVSAEDAAAPAPEAPADAAPEAPADAAPEAPADAVKRKRGPRKKPGPEPVAWFRSRAAAFFRARRSLSGAASVVGDDEASASREDAAQTSGAVARAHLKGVLEALIFASEHPLSSSDLARSAKAEHRVIKSLLAELMDEYRGRGVRLDEIAGGYVFRTSPAFAPFVREHVAKKPVKMTRAQVETLAIIAYKQPITRPEVDEIRGVDSGAILKSLLERELVRILGKKEEAGRPLLYGTTPQFLEFFGLKALGDLPTLREFTELTDESKRMYEREMGEEPMDPGIVLTNMQSSGTEGAQDGFESTSGGLMGGEGEMRSPGAPSANSQHLDAEGAANRTQDGQGASREEQGEEARMKNEQASTIDDLEIRTSSEEDEDEQDEDEDFDDEDEDEDEDDEDLDEDEDDEDEDDEDFEDEDEDEDEDDEDDEDEEDEDE